MSKIIVYGLGYVGLSNAIMFSKNNQVIGIDINEEKINLLNKHISPLKEESISEALLDNKNFTATKDDSEYIRKADYILIATPTNYDEVSGNFDTSSIISVLDKLNNVNTKSIIIIKSTIPVGFTRSISIKYSKLKILFSPEFLREGNALNDCLKPSRIIVGVDDIHKLEAKKFISLIKRSILINDVDTLIMGYEEAESVKLFSNTYLAMRVAYFNELDNFIIANQLNARDVINGICCDNRIGKSYNNPSFGYGGYCFPKDTKQLNSNYNKMNIPNKLIFATIESNKLRKEFIAKHIINITRKNDVIGIYRLIMKSNSDNFRQSAIIDILQIIAKKRKVIIYEPLIKEYNDKNIIIENDIVQFKNNSSLIVANRFTKELEDVYNKVFTRDLFNRD